MANNTYTRRINLYINEKEVKNDIKSIQKEFYKANNELKKMEIGSKQYIAQTQKVKGLKGIIAEHNQQLKEVQKTGLSFSKVTDGFNKYFGVITAVAASFAGLVMAGRKAIDEFNKFDDQVADVMKTTGMTKDEVLELDKRLQKINTRTAQNELLSLGRVAGKLGITGVEDVEGFVRAADKINVALSEDLGGDAEQAINEIGKLTDIFKLKDEFGIEQSMLKVGSAINSLGAASTANEGYLVEFTKRMAGVAPAANVSIDQVLGLGATLDQFGQTSEISSSTISAVLTNMFKSPGEYAAIAGMKIEDFNDLLAKDSNEAFIKFLEGLNGNNDGLGAMANKLEGLGLAGKRSVSVLGVLSNNTQTLRKQQALSAAEFEKGTSLQDEFNIKNETAQAKLEKARKAMALYRRELGEKLQPIMAGVVSKGTLMLKFLSALIDVFNKYRAQIIIVAGTIATYTAAVKIKSKWDQITLAYTKAKMVAEKAYAITSGLVTGKIKLATITQRIWNATVLANPIMAIVAGVAALAAGVVFLVKRLNQASAAQRALNEVQKEAEKATASERNEIEQLVRIAKDERFSREEREKAIKRLNEISPEYLGNLTLENINTEAATKATYDYIKALEEKALVQAIDDKIAKLMEENSNAEIDGNKKKVKWYQTATNAIIAGSNVQMFAELQNKKSLGNEAKANKEYNETLEALMSKRAELLAKGSDATVESGETDDEKAKHEEKERLARQAEEKEAARLLAEQRKKDNEEAAKIATQLAKESYKKELFELRKSMFEKGATRDEMNGVIQLKELEHLSTLLAIQKKYGQDTTSIESSILDKQIKAREDYQKNIEGINKAIANASKDFKLDDEKFETDDEGYQEGIKALDRYQELKQNYQSKEKTDREALNTELADLDEALRLGGILSHEEYEKKKAEITAKYAGERFKKEQEYLQGASAVLNALTSRFEAAKQLELKAAGDNAALKEKIEKKYAKKQQKISIGQALINGAMAQLKILAEVPKADFGVMTAILMTAAAAATAAEIATISNQQFKPGGFTTPADSDSRPAGIVHANEWVASAPLLRNPETRRHIDYLENVQRGIYPRFNTASISAATRGFQIGGYASAPSGTRTDAMPGVSVAQEQNTAMMGAMIGLLQELKQNGVKSQINTQEVFSKQQQYENNLRASEL